MEIGIIALVAVVGLMMWNRWQRESTPDREMRNITPGKERMEERINQLERRVEELERRR